MCLARTSSTNVPAIRHPEPVTCTDGDWYPPACYDPSLWMPSTSVCSTCFGGVVRDRAGGGFGEILRRFRLAAGLSQEALAEQAGLSARGIRAQEGGARGAPRLATVIVLADALGLGAVDRAQLLAAARPDLVDTSSAGSAEESSGLANPDQVGRDEPAEGPHRLPVAPTTLVGREPDVARGCALLQRPGTRLVTLTGPGGVGKTRLAIAIAEGIAPDFDDGAYFVDLAPIRDPRQVAGAVAYALGVRETPGQAPEEAVGQYVAERRLLLLFDNCEQVLDGMTLAARLLALAPNLKILATSRERLLLRGEQEVPVEPLAVPTEAVAIVPARPQGGQGVGSSRGRRQDPPLAGLANIAAIRLFAARAAEARLNFKLDDETVPIVAAICRRLDGLPLAIELAAVQTRLHSPAVLLQRLDVRLSVLTDGPRDLPDRQRTMRDAIAWSYELLSPPEQALFRSLAVFAGGFTPEAAASVAGGDELVARNHDRVADLAGKSLVRAVAQTGPHAGRFMLLETVREFGLERLEDAGELEAVAERHTAHYVVFAEEAERNLQGPLEREWLKRLDAEWTNIRAALVWAREHGWIETELRLTAALHLYWHRRGLLTDGRGWIARALSDAEANPGSFGPASFAGVQVAAAWFSSMYAEADRAVRHAEEAVAVYRVHGPAHQGARAMSLLALAQLVVDPERAQATGREALRWCRSDPDERWIPVVVGNMASVLVRQGALAEAEILLTEQLKLEEARGYLRGVARSLADVGELEIAREAWSDAAAYFRRALPLMEAEGDLTYLSLCLTSLAISAALAGEPYAARLLGAADELGRQTGLGIWPYIARAHKRAISAATANLGDDWYAIEFAAGQGLSVEEAIDAALGGPCA